MRNQQLVSWCIVLFYGVSTLLGSFDTELSHFDKSLKQFSLAEVRSLIVKTILVHSFNVKNHTISSSSVEHKYTVYFYLTHR